MSGLFDRTTVTDRLATLAAAAMALLYWWAVLPQVGLTYLEALAHTLLVPAMFVRTLMPFRGAALTSGAIALLVVGDLVSRTPMTVSPMLVAGPLTLAAVAEFADRRLWAVASFLGFALLALISPLTLDAESPAWTVGAQFAVLAAAFLWGSRRRFVREAHCDELAAREQLARANERLKISTDLHDVLGHSLTLVFAQASAALADPDLAATPAALETIKETSKTALRDLRQFVGGLHQDSRSGAELTRIPVMATSAVRAGLRLAVQLPDERTLAAWQAELPTEVSEALLRCVQEGLTNVLRHGIPHAPASLTVALTAEVLHVEVRNACATTGGHTTGHGLAGLRDRVRQAGGRVTTLCHRSEFLLDVLLPFLPAAGDDHR